jgi:glycosyltransferase involved in cell wall biosynthesis
MDNAINNPREKIIITVSRVTEVKNIELLISSFGVIAGDFKDWKLEIIGPVKDNKYLESLNKIIDKLNLKDRITFKGPYGLEQLKDIYSRASIFCLFSINEGSPISRLEAIASGMYVISSPAGCAEDTAKYGIHIVPFNDIQAFAREIRQGIVSIENGDFMFNRKMITSYDDIIKSIISDSF